MDNSILMNDMVQAHEARMMHLTRYYPFFRLLDTGLSTFTTINQIRNPMKTDMIFKVKFLVSFVFFMSHSSFQQMTQFTVSYNLFILSLDQCRSQFSTGKTSAELSVLGHGHLPGFF